MLIFMLIFSDIDIAIDIYTNINIVHHISQFEDFHLDLSRASKIFFCINCKSCNNHNNNDYDNHNQSKSRPKYHNEEMLPRTIFRYGATRLASTGSRSLLASTGPRSWTASKPLALAASKGRMGSTATPGARFMQGDWICGDCGYHNFAHKTVCPCDTKLSAAIGPYSHVVKTPSAIYVSGQLPMDFEGNLVEGTIGQKTKAVLQNLSEVLSAAGSSLDKVVKVQVFLTDMEDFAEMNMEYENWLTHKPARSCVAVKELPKGVSIEIECIAAP
ncbi:hypothetical protein DSL72_006071 [Monilinia vaccinii-corymbosi]|uniref:RanBP2-type domain-containing protein n=1 Tax=Monilinia vaccinii-corymbosi TaxID=61207 RepID=A0A8A3PGQ8_9HELO|nr:hypothetical protein DSL72_006071 [Monilinia vaccinii-corymbosi]